MGNIRLGGLLGGLIWDRYAGTECSRAAALAWTEFT